MTSPIKTVHLHKRVVKQSHSTTSALRYNVRPARMMYTMCKQSTNIHQIVLMACCSVALSFIRLSKLVTSSESFFLISKSSSHKEVLYYRQNLGMHVSPSFSVPLILCTMNSVGVPDQLINCPQFICSYDSCNRDPCNWLFLIYEPQL